MTYMTYGTNAAHPTLRDRIAARIHKARSGYANWRIYRQTVEELSALDNRDLADLGLSRSMIRGIAYEAAYGK